MKRLEQSWTVAHPRACQHGCALTAASQTQAPHLVWSLLSFYLHVPTLTLPLSLPFHSCLPSFFLSPPPFTPPLIFHSLWTFHIPAEKSWLPSPTAFAYIRRSVGSVPSAASWRLGAMVGWRRVGNLTHGEKPSLILKSEAGFQSATHSQPGIIISNHIHPCQSGLIFTMFVLVYVLRNVLAVIQPLQSPGIKWFPYS